MISDELVPPNPKELDKNTTISFSIATFAIFNLAESSSGFSKFILGATKEFCIISIEYTISLAPSHPAFMPGHRFCGTYQWPVFTKNLMNSPGFAGITCGGGGCMGINIIYITGLYACIFHRHIQATSPARQQLDLKYGRHLMKNHIQLLRLVFLHLFFGPIQDFPELPLLHHRLG